MFVLCSSCRHSISRVSPEWLGRLASAGGATKFAREAALKEFLKTGCEQPIPQAAAAASDTASLLEAAVQKVMSAERDAIAKLGGNDKTKNKLSAYLMGKLMQETRGAIDPQQVCQFSCGFASSNAQSNLHRASKHICRIKGDSPDHMHFESNNVVFVFTPMPIPICRFEMPSHRLLKQHPKDQVEAD